MTWAAVVPVVLACAALLFIPGGLVAAAMGLRGLLAAAAAPVFTVTLSGVAAIVFGLAGIGWTIWGLAAASAISAAALWLVRGAIERRWRIATQHANRRAGWPVAIQALGFASGAGIITSQLVRVYGSPGNISQTFDNVFHLNAVRYILNTADASSLTLTSMTNGDNPPYFYPAAWHGLVALLVQMTNAPIAVGANMFNLVLAASVWTLGCMLLIRTVAGPKPWTIAFAGILAAGFSSFPLLLLDFGVLYPNFLSLCMLPAGLAAVAVFFNVGSQLALHPVARFAVAPLIAPGIAIAHPNGIMTLLAVSVPVVLYAFWRRYIAGGLFATHRRESVLASAALAASMAVLVVLWKYIRPPAEAAFWDRYHSPAGAGWEILTNSAMNRPEAWVVSILMLVGLYAGVQGRRHWWLLGCFAVTSVLFVVIAGVPTSYWRSLLTGVWYNDSYRVAAVLPLTALPLAALGFDWLSRRIRLFLAEAEQQEAGPVGRFAGSMPARTAAGALAVIVLAVGMQVPAMNFAVATASKSYAEAPAAEVVSSDELALIDQLDDLVPAGETIAVNPWTGAALAYALADRPTTSRHVLSTYPADIETINNSLRDAAADPAVCDAVKATGVRYALDFGDKEVHGGHHAFPGLDNLGDSPAAELVAQVGEAKLFRITACT